MAVLPVAIQIVSVPVRRRGLDDDVIEGARVLAPLDTVLLNGRALILDVPTKRWQYKIAAIKGATLMCEQLLCRIVLKFVT